MAGGSTRVAASDLRGRAGRDREGREYCGGFLQPDRVDGARPFARHTYYGITDDGYFFNHDPQGDTLYGAEIYVDPAERGQGIGALLYVIRRELCKRLNMRRILAGGRLSNF